MRRKKQYGYSVIANGKEVLFQIVDTKVNIPGSLIAFKKYYKTDNVQIVRVF